MRTLFSLCALGAVSLGLIGLAPSQAGAAWWNRGAACYYPAYYAPAYSASYAPAYSAYYAPTYSSFYSPSYVSSYYAAPAMADAYYRPAYSSYYPGYSSYYYAPASINAGNVYAYPSNPTISYFNPF